MNTISLIRANLLPDSKIIFTGKDLLMSSLPYYLFLALQITLYQTIWEHAWLSTLAIYLLIPALDEIFGPDCLNPNTKERK